MSNEIRRNIDHLIELGEWSIVSKFQETCEIEPGKLKIFLTGIEANHSIHGNLVSATAGTTDYNEVLAYYEMLERIAMMSSLYSADNKSLKQKSLDGRYIDTINIQSLLHEDEKKSNVSFRFAKSNGVALHQTFLQAARTSIFEATERQLLLESWLGMRMVSQIKDSKITQLDHLQYCYTISMHSFGSIFSLDLNEDVHCYGVFMIPKDGFKEINPLCFGFGAHSDVELAKEKSIGECIQRLGFLWGEEIPSQEPDFGTDVNYHQEYYLYPANHIKILDWLSNTNFSSAYEKEQRVNAKFNLFDITPDWFTDYAVVKAIEPNFLPLVFGRYKLNCGNPTIETIHPIP